MQSPSSLLNAEMDKKTYPWSVYCLIVTITQYYKIIPHLNVIPKVTEPKCGVILSCSAAVKENVPSGRFPHSATKQQMCVLASGFWVNQETEYAEAATKEQEAGSGSSDQSKFHWWMPFRAGVFVVNRRRCLSASAELLCLVIMIVNICRPKHKPSLFQIIWKSLCHGSKFWKVRRVSLIPTLGGHGTGSEPKREALWKTF